MIEDWTPEVSYQLALVAGRYAVCRLPAQAELPDWAHPEHLLSITWRAGETSIVCPERYVPPEVKAERGWRALEVSGPLDFVLVGVLSSLLLPLAQAQVSVFVLSTFDTDLILIPEVQVERALNALGEAGHLVKLNDSKDLDL
jgi:hypothetical protein